MVGNYKNSDCSSNNKFIALFITIFGTLSYTYSAHFSSHFWRRAYLPLHHAAATSALARERYRHASAGRLNAPTAEPPALIGEARPRYAIPGHLPPRTSAAPRLQGSLRRILFLRYDMRCYFNMRSNAVSLNYCTEPKTIKWKTEKTEK